MLFCFSQQTKQIHSFDFWKNLWRNQTAFGLIWPLTEMKFSTKFSFIPSLCRPGGWKTKSDQSHWSWNVNHSLTVKKISWCAAYSHTSYRLPLPGSVKQQPLTTKLTGWSKNMIWNLGWFWAGWQYLKCLRKKISWCSAYSHTSYRVPRPGSVNKNLSWQN